jgi:hypothetical protein
MIIDLLKEGFALSEEERFKKEQDSKGTLRGGSCGCFIKETGQVYGVCPRKSLLRYEGFQKKTTYETYLNFVAGFGHEVNVLNLLISNPKVAQVEMWDKPDYYAIASDKIKLHETSIEGSIDGVKWTGRPDLVVTLDTGKKYLLEDKVTISSDKAENSTQYPFIYAICQAYKYRTMLDNLDTYLVYGNYSNFGEFKMGGKAFPKDKRLPNVEYRDFPHGVYKKVGCNIFEYAVAAAEDGYIWILDSKDKATRTPLTAAGVDDYYRLLISSAKDKTLPPRPQEDELYGKTKYSPCKYCEYAKMCDSYDKEYINYNQFLTESRKV